MTDLSTNLVSKGAKGRNGTKGTKLTSRRGRRGMKVTKRAMVTKGKVLAITF